MNGIADLEARREITDVLLQTVRELLHQHAIGADDDFFLAGGHSLLGTQLVMRARKLFGVKVSLRDVFEAGTVSRLAEQIDTLMSQEILAAGRCATFQPNTKGEV